MAENSCTKRSAEQAELSTTNSQYRDEQSLHNERSRPVPARARNGERHPASEINMARSEHSNHHPEALDQTDGPWSVAESKSSKKKRKIANKIAKGYDDPPGISLMPSRPAQIQLKALQELVLYILGDGVAPTWLAVNNARQILKVVVLMVPGLDQKSLENSDIFKPPAKNERKETGHLKSTESEVATQSEGEGMAANLPLPPSDELSSNTSAPVSQDVISGLIDHIVQVKAPGDSGRHQIHSPLQSMLISSYSEPKDKRAKSEESRSVRTAIGGFIHTADELRDAEYPIHPAAFDNQRDAQLEHERREKTFQSTSAGWVDTIVSRSEIPVLASPSKPSRPHAHDSLVKGHKVYAIDCEMVLTDDDKYSLARISIIDWSGKTVLDKYVLPSLPIKNYFTQFSGITAKILENVTTTLQDIQKELLAIIGPDTILLGHSLESDLNALKLTHPNIIDTSIIYPHPRGLPLRSSLKYLANKFLKREIQKGGADGHDSVEDARAVLDLVRMKCEKGPRWGTMDANGESIFRRISRAVRQVKEEGALSSSRGKSRESAIVEYGTPERGFGKDATYKIACENDDEIISGVLRASHGDTSSDSRNEQDNENDVTDIAAEGPENNGLTTKQQEPANTERQPPNQIPTGGADFIWGRLRDLEAIRGWNTPPAPLPANPTPSDLSYESATPSSPPPNPSADPALEQAMTGTLTRLADLYVRLPPKTLLIVFNGTGDMRPVLKLQQLHAQYRREFKIKKWDELDVKWTDVEEQALRRAVDKARRGFAAVAVR